MANIAAMTRDVVPCDRLSAIRQAALGDPSHPNRRLP